MTKKKPTTPPDPRLRYATGAELKAPPPPVLTPAEQPPGQLRNLAARWGVKADPNANWVPGITHDYYRNLDHGVRPETRGIVLHVNDGYYGKKGQSGTLFFFQPGNPPAHSGGVGAHFELGYQTAQSVQLVPLSRKAWHNVKGNSSTIGIEHAGFGRSRSEWIQNHEREIIASAQITSWILHRYQLGAPHVSHHDIHVGNIWSHSAGGTSWGGHDDCPGSQFVWDIWESYCKHFYETHWRR